MSVILDSVLSFRLWIPLSLSAAKSRQVEIDSGVPQGTVLGPLLFLCHINDLPERVDSQIRLFADDCLLYRPINSMKDYQTLQEDFNNPADSKPTLGQRWLIVVHIVGPTLGVDVGPTSIFFIMPTNHTSSQRYILSSGQPKLVAYCKYIGLLPKFII